MNIWIILLPKGGWDTNRTPLGITPFMNLHVYNPPVLRLGSHYYGFPAAMFAWAQQSIYFNWLLYLLEMQEKGP